MDTCDGDIITVKVLVEVVCPQEGEISIPFYLIKQVMIPSNSKDFPEILHLEHAKFLNLRKNYHHERENNTSQIISKILTQGN